MTQTQTTPPPFSAEITALAALRGLPALRDQRGHCYLAEGIWLSSDPQGEAAFDFTPTDGGFRLKLRGGDSARWACLGFLLPLTELRDVRRLGLRVSLKSDGLVAYHPSLRHGWHGGGHQDVFAEHWVLAPGGAQICESHMQMDPDALARAARCELTIFFQSDQFSAEFMDITPFVAD